MKKLRYIQKPEKLISQVKLALRPFFDHVQLVILFGSLATGNFLINSDIDILVVGNNKDEKNNIRKTLDNLFVENGILVDLKYMTTDQFELNRHSGFITEVLETGILLWEKEKIV